ncbi:MAG TPA: LysM peptidoglycan-binding domain-containing protein, partial [Aggregatilineales bacterium]|nr:LysM peptidoglycan-binding domain-containing protein [Aggregatilineales bacterium]
PIVVPTILQLPTALPATTDMPIPTNTPAVVQQNCTPRSDWSYQYRVVSGDTLSRIAQLISSTADTLASGNCLVSANSIFVGQVLRVPAIVPNVPNNLHRISFDTGTSTITLTGTAPASDSDFWVLTILGGQTLSVQSTFAAPNMVLVVYGVNGVVLQSDHVGAGSFSGVVPTTQDYYLQVVNLRPVQTSYNLTVTVPPLPATLTAQPPPPAIPGPTVRRIQFPLGATSVAVQGQLPVYNIDEWLIAAQAGQTLSAQLVPSSGQGIIFVYGANGVVLQTPQQGTSSFQAVLPTTQDYQVYVEAITNSGLNYTLNITIPPLP